MKIIHSISIKPLQVLAILGLVIPLMFLGFDYSSDDKKTEMVVLTTKYGEMTILLYDDTPLHKDNFLKLAREGYYNDLLFHRVIANFMVQGGDPDSREAGAGKALGKGGPDYTIPAEFSTKFIHKKGALAAARQGDAVNPEKESSGSQFYIVHGNTVTEETLSRVAASRPGIPDGQSVYSDEQREIYTTLGGTPHLDGGYTVFGEVTEGLHVLDSIAAQPVDRMNRPLTDIGMTMKIVKK